MHFDRMTEVDERKRRTSFPPCIDCIPISINNLISLILHVFLAFVLLLESSTLVSCAPGRTDVVFGGSSPSQESQPQNVPLSPSPFFAYSSSGANAGKKKTSHTSTPLPASETTAGQQKSANVSRLCPQVVSGQLDELLTRYDESVRKCGTIGFPAHCPDRMIFYSYPESKVQGHCDCAYDETGTQKPLVYNAKENKCFSIFDQGYCAPGQWIAPNGEGEPGCTRSKCQNIFAGTQRQNASDFVLFRGECVRLNVAHRECNEDEVIGFTSDDLEPKCRAKVGKVSINTKGVGSVRSLKCAPGTYLSITGKCLQGFRWD